MTSETRTIRCLSRYWPELVAAIAPLIVFAHILFGGQVMYWGLPALQFVPWRELVNDALRTGHLPLWSPLLGLGAPLLANYQSAPLYPPNWLALLLPPETAVSVLAVLHLSLAGVGVVRVARRLGLSDFGAGVAGLSFGLSGYLTGRLWFVTINNAAAWLPWILLAASISPTQLRSKETTKRFLVLTLLLALQLLSGHAQTTFYTLLLTVAWIIWTSLFLPQQPARPTYHLLITNLAVFGCALLFALALTSIQLVPVFELLRLSPRADAAEYEFAMTYSLWPWRLLTAIFPNLYGNPADHNYWGYATYWEDHLYIGLLPLIFALFSLKLIVRRRSENAAFESALRSVVIFCGLTALVSILLALGNNTPIFPFLYRYVPGFDLFQAPARMLIWYTFAASVLAGIGAHLWQASDRKRYWSRLGTAGSLGMGALALAGGYALRAAQVATFGSAIATSAAIGVAIFILLLNQPKQSRRWYALAIGLITIDLGLAAFRLTPTTDRSLYALSPSFAQADGRLYQSADDEYNSRFVDLFPFTSFNSLNPQALRDSLVANLPVLYGIATTNNFDPLVTARYANFIKAMEQNPRLLDLADVTAIVKRKGAVSLRPPGAARLRVIYDARIVGSADEALAAITNPAFDPGTSAILETVPAAPFPGLALDPNTYSTTVTLERDGYVVLSDSYYPGWRVQVDGAPAPIFIADYAFRAVAVPAGTHTINFEYAPTSVTLGLLISAGALVIFMVALTLYFRK